MFLLIVSGTGVILLYTIGIILKIVCRGDGMVKLYAGGQVAAIIVFCTAKLIKTKVLIVGDKTLLPAIGHQRAVLGFIDHRKTVGGKVGVISRLQDNLGPVADEGNVGKGGLQFVAGIIGIARLAFVPVVRIVAVFILLGSHIGERDHLPEAGFLFTQKGGKHLIVPPEGNAAGMVSDKMHPTAGIGQGDGRFIGILRNLLRDGISIIVFEGIVIRSFTHFLGLHVFLQIARAAEDSQVHGLKVRTLTQGLGRRPLPGNGESNLHPALRFHGKVRLPFARAGQG